MRLLPKIAFGSLAAVLLISGIAVITPRAVQAVVATIIRDQDNPARHPFATKCTIENNHSNGAICDTPAIPAGEEVVVETISIDGLGDPGNFVLGVRVTTVVGGVSQDFRLNPIFDSEETQPSFATYHGNQSLRLYSDPGFPIEFFAETSASNSTGLSVIFTISGYFVTLP
jgi:hypothetical protein